MTITRTLYRKAGIGWGSFAHTAAPVFAQGTGAALFEGRCDIPDIAWKILRATGLQITIPVDIRRKLGVKDGDKILFVEDAGKIYILNSSMEALREAQMAFSGEAEHAGLEDDAVALMKGFRRERTAE